jgi:hypothetical protein
VLWPRNNEQKPCALAALRDKKKPETYSIKLRSVKTLAEQAEIASATQANKSLSACCGLAMRVKPLRLSAFARDKKKSEAYSIKLRSLETFAEQAEIASATQANKSLSACCGLATTNKNFAP